MGEVGTLVEKSRVSVPSVKGSRETNGEEPTVTTGATDATLVTNLNSNPTSRVATAGLIGVPTRACQTVLRPSLQITWIPFSVCPQDVG